MLVLVLGKYIKMEWHEIWKSYFRWRYCKLQQLTSSQDRKWQFHLAVHHKAVSKAWSSFWMHLIQDQYQQRRLPALDSGMTVLFHQLSLIDNNLITANHSWFINGCSHAWSTLNHVHDKQTCDIRFRFRSIRTTHTFLYARLNIRMYVTSNKTSRIHVL